MDFLNSCEDEEEEDAGDLQEFLFSKEAIIVLIDNSVIMHQKILEKESAFHLSLKCSCSILKNKIIINDPSILSIVLYENKTKKISKESEFEHINIIHELSLPSGKLIMQLEKSLENNCDEFKNDAGDNLLNLSEALWACSHLFSSCKSQNYYKKIYVFTNNDMPYGNSKEKKLQLLSRVSDLQQNNIEIIIMHINQDKKAFEFNLQYKDILFNDDDDFIVYPNASNNFEELLSRIQYNNYKKRKLGRVPFIFKDDLRMAVSLYKLYYPRRKAPPLKLYKATNEEVVLNSKSFLKSNLDLLGAQDIKKCQIFLDKKICFDKEEIFQMKNTLEAGFYLIGFIHKSMVKTYEHVQSAKFIYPEDTLIKGSIVLFTALLKQMLDSENVAICKFIPNNNHEANIVALFPQEEKLSEHKLQICPPGFHVIYIPFVDDQRLVSLQPNNKQEVGKLEIEKAKELVKKLQFVFDCDSFENPTLQKHYLDIEAIALERKAPENFKDFTEPDDAQIEHRIGHLLDEFKSLFDPISSTPKSNKRKLQSDSSMGNKCIKFDGSVEEIGQIAAEGNLVTFTVPILKEMAKILQIKNQSTKKADIINAIKNHFA